MLFSTTQAAKIPEVENRVNRFLFPKGGGTRHVTRSISGKILSFVSASIRGERAQGRSCDDFLHKVFIKNGISRFGSSLIAVGLGWMGGLVCVSGIGWVSVGYQLGIGWVSVGYQLGIGWGSVGDRLGIGVTTL
jgi:hypothetical protein